VLGLSYGCSDGDGDAASQQAEADARLAQAIQKSAQRRERQRESHRAALPPASTTQAPASGVASSNEPAGGSIQPPVSRDLFSVADRASFSRLAAPRDRRKTRGRMATAGKVAST